MLEPDGANVDKVDEDEDEDVPDPVAVEPGKPGTVGRLDAAADEPSVGARSPPTPGMTCGGPRIM